jgi:hypothetical protein
VLHAIATKRHMALVRLHLQARLLAQGALSAQGVPVGPAGPGVKVEQVVPVQDGGPPGPSGSAVHHAGPGGGLPPVALALPSRKRALV